MKLSSCSHPLMSWIPAPPASPETESHPSSHLLPRKQPPPTITQYPRKKLTFLFVCLYLLFIILLFVYVWEKSRIVGSVPQKTDFETYLLGSTCGNNTCRRVKEGLGSKRSWSSKQLQKRPQPIPWGTLNVGWPFRDVLNWGRGRSALVLWTSWQHITASTTSALKDLGW